MADPNYGFTAGGEFAPAFEAAQAAQRAGQTRQRSSLARAIAARGVRTSGVGTIPQASLAADFASQDAGLVGDFALNQAREGITDRRSAEDFQRRLQLLDRQGDLQRTLARRQMQGQILGGGLGAIGSIASLYALRPNTAGAGGTP